MRCYNGLVYGTSTGNKNFEKCSTGDIITFTFDSPQKKLYISKVIIVNQRTLASLAPSLHWVTFSNWISNEGVLLLNNEHWAKKHEVNLRIMAILRLLRKTSIKVLYTFLMQNIIQVVPEQSRLQSVKIPVVDSLMTLK